MSVVRAAASVSLGLKNSQQHTKLARKLVGKRGVVLLEQARNVRVGAGHRDGRVGVARDRKGGVVDARVAQANGGGEGGFLRRQRHLVKNDGLRSRGNRDKAVFWRREKEEGKGKKKHTLRSPWASAVPARSTNFLCWRIALVASDDGDQTAAAFFRQRSLRDARIETTTVRLSGCSGLDVLKELASASACSDGACMVISAIPPTGAADVFMGTPAFWSASTGTCSACCIAGER